MKNKKLYAVAINILSVIDSDHIIDFDKLSTEQQARVQKLSFNANKHECIKVANANGLAGYDYAWLVVFDKKENGGLFAKAIDELGYDFKIAELENIPVKEKNKRVSINKA